MNIYHNDRKVIGRQFDRLTPIERVNQTGKAVYRCKCICGNEVEVKGDYLTSKKTHSCGCLKSENSKMLMQKIFAKGQNKLKEGMIDGTNTVSFGQKVSKNSKTGIKGVSLTRTGKYRAYLTIKRKQIHLGLFDTPEEAAQARKIGEEMYYKPYLEIKNEI